jgi:hypothetical protein
LQVRVYPQMRVAAITDGREGVSVAFCVSGTTRSANRQT